MWNENQNCPQALLLHTIIEEITLELQAAWLHNIFLDGISVFITKVRICDTLPVFVLFCWPTSEAEE